MTPKGKGGKMSTKDKAARKKKMIGKAAEKVMFNY